MRLKITSTTKARYTPRPRTQEATVEMSKDFLAAAPLSILTPSVLLRLISRISAVREHLHQVALCDLLLGEQRDNGTLPQGDHAITALRYLVKLRGDKDDTQTLRR